MFAVDKVVIKESYYYSKSNRCFNRYRNCLTFILLGGSPWPVVATTNTIMGSDANLAYSPNTDTGTIADQHSISALPALTTYVAYSIN